MSSSLGKVALSSRYPIELSVTVSLFTGAVLQELPLCGLCALPPVVV